MVRNVVQSFKKVINHAPASRVAATLISFPISSGVDSVAAGQTGPTDVDVPTGSVLKYIEIQFSAINLVSVASFMWVSLMHLHAGQGGFDPRVVGGNNLRNQVHFQKMYTLGQDQNSNIVLRFKIPKKYQRVREGDRWELETLSDTIHTSACQIIYKFYR